MTMIYVTMRHDILYLTYATLYGCMRKEPSSLMVSPLSILFSIMACTNAAYSDGLPSRLGNGTVAARSVRTYAIFIQYEERIKRQL
jgi:hypothetical protein